MDKQQYELFEQNDVEPLTDLLVARRKLLNAMAKYGEAVIALPSDRCDALIEQMHGELEVELVRASTKYTAASAAA